MRMTFLANTTTAGFGVMDLRKSDACERRADVQASAATIDSRASRRRLQAVSGTHEAPHAHVEATMIDAHVVKDCGLQLDGRRMSCDDEVATHSVK